MVRFVAPARQHPAPMSADNLAWPVDYTYMYGDGLAWYEEVEMEFNEVREVSSTSAVWEIDNDNLYRQSPIPLYGLLLTWRGNRLLGDSERSSTTSLDSGLTESQGLQLGLMHGDVLDRKAPQLHVVSSIGVNPSLAWLLSTRIGMAGGAPPEPKGGLPDTQARGEMVSFRVNDDSVTFELLQGPGGWVARADRDDHQITMEGITFSSQGR